MAARPAALVALLAIGVGACGGGSDAGTTTGTAPPQGAPLTTGTSATAPGSSGSPADERRGVLKAIEAGLASSDPKVACGSAYVTDRYLSTAWGDESGCRRAHEVPGSTARVVAVSGVKVSGRGAVAVAVPSGGPSDGERITVRLVFEGGTWKVDAARSNVPVGP